MSTGNVNKYGIKIIARTTKTRPKTVESLADSNHSKVITSAKKVIAEHRDVLKALAKR